MKTLKEQVKELNDNQTHILEAVKYLNEKLEHLEERIKDDKSDEIKDIIDVQGVIDRIIVKNSDDIDIIKKKKEENAASIKLLEDKICIFDKNILTMTNNLQIQIEILKVKVDEKDAITDDNKQIKVKFKYFDRGFCKKRGLCAYKHNSTKVCDCHESGRKCRNQECSDRHPKLCHYFNRGFCFRNENCSFLHKLRQIKTVENKNYNESTSDKENMDVDIETNDETKDDTIYDDENEMDDNINEHKSCSAECGKCGTSEEVKNQCSKCGKSFCSKCEFKFNGESVMEFYKSFNFENYTCLTAHY